MLDLFGSELRDDSPNISGIFRVTPDAISHMSNSVTVGGGGGTTAAGALPDGEWGV